jgi:hypothetical protein
VYAICHDLRYVLCALWVSDLRQQAVKRLLVIHSRPNVHLLIASSPRLVTDCRAFRLLRGAVLGAMTISLAYTVYYFVVDEHFCNFLERFLWRRCLN